MAEMTVKELYIAAKELSLKWWGIEFDGDIEIKNRRWKYVDGRFTAPINLPEGLNITPLIAMCKKRNGERTEEEIKGTLLHELVHWRLFTTGVPHRDSDQEFVREAVRVGAPISKAPIAQRAYEKYMQLTGVDDPQHNMCRKD